MRRMVSKMMLTMMNFIPKMRFEETIYCKSGIISDSFLN
ncbi:hypothetical protein PULV_a3253 [Pseudoalteromonas ulvae UL12]|nr:hypothetical protein [Pseudoalteromonas ulvae UL12]